MQLQKLLTVGGKYKQHSPGKHAEVVKPSAVASPEGIDMLARLEALDAVAKFREEQNQVLKKIGTMKSDEEILKLNDKQDQLKVANNKTLGGRAWQLGHQRDDVGPASRPRSSLSLRVAVQLQHAASWARQKRSLRTGRVFRSCY